MRLTIVGRLDSLGYKVVLFDCSVALISLLFGVSEDTPGHRLQYGLGIFYIVYIGTDRYLSSLHSLIVDSTVQMKGTYE